MMRLLYLPLEPYEERYTRQLLDWTTTRAALHRDEMDLHIVYGSTAPGPIQTGVVLDAYARAEWATSQTAALVRLMKKLRPLSRSDVILTHDLFHPGWSAVPYILDQLPPAERPRCYTQCWAQSVDVYDFTFPMRRWMRPYEQLCDQTYSGIFLASFVQVDLWRAAGLDAAPLHVIGLPFDRFEVLRRVDGVIPPLVQRPRRVLYTARWDPEKQPGFFMDLILAAQQDGRFDGVSFEAATGAPALRSTDPVLVARARKMQERGLLTIHEGLSKRDYYGLLTRSRVQFNCALQDFVSFTLLEASALGTPSLYPAFRSFPEALASNRDCLYVPWSVEDALEKLHRLLLIPPDPETVAVPAHWHHETLDRMLAILKGVVP